MKKYFVSYVFAKGANTGTGFVEIKWEGIFSGADIINITRKIELQANFDSVTVMFWREFETQNQISGIKED